MPEPTSLEEVEGVGAGTGGQYHLARVEGHVTRPLLAGCLLAILVFAASAWPTLPSMVDDAYVSLRYAHHLALGHGLVFNAGEPPVEGYTNLLWVLWMAPGTVLPLHPSTWATGWGLAFGALALFNATGVGVALCGRGSPWALVPAAILALLPVFGIAATNGLETAQYVALLLGATWAALDGRRPVLTGLLSGLLYLVRPEGLAAGGVLTLLAASRLGRTRAAARPIVAFAAVVLPYFLARWSYFGTLVPNTFSAQAREPFLDMFAMNLSYYERSAGLYGGTVALFLLAVLVGPRRVGVYALLLVAAGLTLVSMRVFNWMPGARLFLAPIALVACVAAPTLQGLRGPVRAGVLGGLTLGLLWLALGDSRRVETRYDQRNTALPGNEAERMGRRIAAIAAPGAWLLSRDAGVVPYFAGPDVNVIDIHPFSLTDPRLTGKPFDLDYVLGKAPAFLVTTATTPEELPTIYAPERSLLRDPRVAGKYVHAQDAYQHYRRWYSVWVRDDVPRGTVFDDAPALPAK
jgi:arabinofuranosyltransferase